MGDFILYTKTMSKSPHASMKMAEMVAHKQNTIQPVVSSLPQPAVLDTNESMKNYKITAWLNSKNFQGWLTRWMVLPGDEYTANSDIRNSKQNKGRAQEWFRQSAMPWGSRFMVTPTDDKRWNNVSQASFVKQPQKKIPNTYGQWYAMMHAMSAAFGNLTAK